MRPLLAALAVLLSLSVAIPPAQAQGDEALRLQQVLDELEILESLVQGRVTDATRRQAIEQITLARANVMVVQQSLQRAQGGVTVTSSEAGASVSVTETPTGASTQVQVGAPGANFSFSVSVDAGAEGPPPPPTAVVAPPPPPPGPTIMDPAAFSQLQAAIDEESFSDGKLKVLREAIAAQRIDVDQAAQLLPLFDFSSDRVEACVLLYPALVDPQDFYRLYSSFDFDSDKDAVRERLGL